MPAQPLFIGGTSSNAGKSWMATAICAWLRRRGVAVAPFKAQNMSNHSFPCRGGGEIGRAQVAQAEACGLEPEPAMNPILLKPGATGCHVVLNGHPWKTLPARGYYEAAAELRGHVRAAYEDLARRFDVIVIEGAGSVSELNLREVDLVNLGLVTALDAPWLLVADIERGGVFASILGTVGLLNPHERALFRGFAINKFRGDLSLFDDGVRLLETRTASPCFGVFPFAAEIALDAEDSLSIPATHGEPPPGARIAIVRFPCLSNATDFRLLTWADWISAPPPDDYDFVILPGTRSTIPDLSWLRASGLADWIASQHRRGATVIGICGGFQMMGRAIHDPSAIESEVRHAHGLNLLPADTVMHHDKTTCVRTATTAAGTSFAAYEIHIGTTTLDGAPPPFARFADGRDDGACVPGAIGTYLHGALEHPDVCAELFRIAPPAAADRSAQYDRLADWFERYARNLPHLGLGIAAP
jgi:adenosylcobyric acid synthase